MTPALTFTLSAQAMTAASALIGQQMRLADVLIDQTISMQRAVITPYFASDIKAKTPVAKKKSAAAKLKAKVAKKASQPAPKPKLVVEAKAVTPKPIEAKPVAATPAAAIQEKAAPKAAVEAAKPVSMTPSVVAIAPAHVGKKPVETAKKAAMKLVAETVSKTPVEGTTPPTAEPVVVAPKPTANPTPALRGKTVSVLDTPWEGKKKPLQK
jgi:hypothetical protein